VAGEKPRAPPSSSSLSYVCVDKIYALYSGDEGCQGKDPGPPRTGFFPDRPPNAYVKAYISDKVGMG